MNRPCAKSIFFSTMVKSVNERATGREVKLRDGKKGGGNKQVYYADDTALVAETRGNLQHIVIERVNERMGQKWNG